MNKLINLTTILILVATVSYSQTISCTNFTIIGSFPDTINPNEYQLSINFNAGTNEIVNYPYISAILDCNGDTVAIGGLYYFGQLGQTTQDYPVTLVDTNSWCEPLTAVFIYGSGPLNEEDTCWLTFQSASIDNVSEVKNSMIYPNPASELLHISASDKSIGKRYEIVNQMGKVLKEGIILSKFEKIEIKNLPHGFYSVLLSGDLIQSISFIKE